MHADDQEMLVKMFSYFVLFCFVTPLPLPPLQNSSSLTRFYVFPFLLLSKTFFLGPLHESPVDRAGPVTGTNYALGSYEKFQPGFWDEKRQKILGTSSGPKFQKQSKHGETQKKYNFLAYHSFSNS